MNTEHTDTAMIERDRTEQIIGAFFDVYNNLGFGFLESAYVNALCLELQRRGVQYEREVAIEVQYLGVPIGRYRVDVIVDGRVLVEVKSTKNLTEADTRQVLNYLKATNLEVGLLLHFGPSPKFHRLLYTNDRKQQIGR